MVVNCDMQIEMQRNAMTIDIKKDSNRWSCDKEAS